MRTALVILILAVGLAGCGGGKDYAYEPANESPPGKGLLSGDDGVFTLYEQTGESQPSEKKELSGAEGADVER